MARPMLLGRGVRRQRGFTLIEILIAVAIIGVLVGLAVISFSKQTRKARGAEAQAMFAALRVAQEQYHLENGVYLAAGSETTTHPTTPGQQSQSFLPLPAAWTQLKVRIPEENGYCGYAAIVGDANDAANIGTIAQSFGLTTAPATDWYYLIAHCDLDGNGSKDSYYFTWSGDTTVQKQNEGY